MTEHEPPKIPAGEGAPEPASVDPLIQPIQEATAEFADHGAFIGERLGFLATTAEGLGELDASRNEAIERLTEALGAPEARRIFGIPELPRRPKGQVIIQQLMIAHPRPNTPSLFGKVDQQERPTLTAWSNMWTSFHGAAGEDQTTTDPQAGETPS